MSLHGEYKMPGAKLVVVDLDVHDGHLANVQVSGDFFLEPDTALTVIDTTLEGLPADSDEPRIAAILHTALGNQVSMFGISPESIAVAVRRALDTNA